MSKNSLKLLIIELLFTACQKPFVPKTDYVQPALVIEGYLSTQKAVQQVFLSYSDQFGQRPKYLKEQGASVYVTDEQGDRFDYYETGGAGVYQSSITDDVKGMVGHTYTLHIITKNGDEYESSPQTIQPCPQPLKLTCKPGQEEVLSVDAYGDPLEIYYNGIEIDVSSNGELPSGNFYQYVWDGYEEHKTTVPHTLFTNYYYQHRKLSNLYLNVVRTGDADGLSGHALQNKKILFIPLNYLNDFTPMLLPGDSSAKYYSSFTGLLFRLEQRSLTPEAYEFWNGAENQLSATGSLFDPIASQINGNMHCISDSTKRVYGIFTAYDKKNEFAYFYYNGKHSYSRSIDSFPTLVLDTFSLNQIPPGWINPPF